MRKAMSAPDSMTSCAISKVCLRCKLVRRFDKVHTFTLGYTDNQQL